VEGRPGDQIFPRIARIARCRSCLVDIPQHLRVEVLRPPPDSALHTEALVLRPPFAIVVAVNDHRR
ncbi:MAG: hypothetical protein ACRDWD_16480, partial [Acidimicrobiia bacterium]